MDRRTALKQMLAIGGALALATSMSRSADAAEVRVRPQMRRWINRHRRYLHHHLPRRRR